VIARCLDRLLQDRKRGDFEILVVCNGCSDNTAAVARGFGEAVRVIETETPSKTHALNLGDAAASGFPRLYIDADVVLSPESVRKVAAALDKGPALAAAPRPVDVFLPGTQWAVRAYYRFWGALPYIQEGMIAAGAYGLSRAGRARFQDFPEVIADDGYVRIVQFDPTDKREVVQNFIRSFKAKYNQEPTHINAHAFDQILVVADVIRRGGKDSQSIRDTMATTKDFSGVTGSVEFDKTNQNTKMDTIHYVETLPDLSWKALGWN